MSLASRRIGSSAMRSSSGASASTRPWTIAAEHRGEIEAEAVDVHLHHPVAQRVEDEIAHDRMARVDRVSRAGEVAVEALVVVQPVVDRVVDAAERERRPQLVAFDRCG